MVAQPVQGRKRCRRECVGQELGKAITSGRDDWGDINLSQDEGSLPDPMEA